MFSLWMCLSLLYVLQSRVSSDEVVSLTCNQTVSVTFGANVTLKCFINWTLEEEECTALNHVWRNTSGTKLCNRGSTKYTCESDLSYMSLTVSNVQEEENFTAEITSNCGMEKSQPIRVQLLTDGPKSTQSYREQEEASPPVTAILLCASAAVAALVILYFLYRRYRHRVNGRTYAAAGSQDSV